MNVICLGETLLRYATKKGDKISNLSFRTHVGGSETNIAVNLAQLGFKATMITRLPDNDLGNSVINFLKSYGVDTTYIQRDNNRIGTYYLEVGVGNRASRVIYDRQHTSMTKFNINDYDLNTIFKNIDAFIVSGISLAVSEQCKLGIYKILDYCKQNNITVIYDNNYRSKMWNLADAGIAFKAVLPYVNILSAGILDAENFLELTSSKENYDDKLNDYYQTIITMYPNIKYITSTRREIVSASINNINGYLFHNNTLYKSKQYVIDDIVDRVGGGDAYLSGIIYGIYHNYNCEEILERGLASTILKHTIHGDANQFTAIDIENYVIGGVAKINR